MRALLRLYAAISCFYLADVTADTVYQHGKGFKPFFHLNPLSGLLRLQQLMMWYKFVEVSTNFACTLQMKIHIP